MFYRDDVRDDFWHCGLDTLVKTDGNPDEVAGGPKSHSARGVGCYLQIHLRRIAGRLHHEGLDAR